MNVEPWMTGTRADLDPLRAAVLYSFDHAVADVTKWTEGLSDESLWAITGDVGSVGFHIRHIAGSAERLTTYATGEQLSGEQLAALKSETEGGETLDSLLSWFRASLETSGQAIRNLQTTDYSAVREIGRKRVPVPLGVLLVHIAEHTQRHVGAMIVTTKLVRGSGR